MGAKHSAEWGANKERTAILARLRRLRKTKGAHYGIEALEAWILLRNERYAKRKGGLGR